MQPEVLARVMGNYLRVRGEYILLWLFASELRNYLRVRGEY